MVSTEMIKNLEKSFGCTGMCKSPLFYFSRKMDMGSPSDDDSCLIHFKNFFTKEAHWFLIFSTLTSTFTTFLFLSHLCLYSRKSNIIDYETNQT